MAYYLGLDLGGTNIKAGVVDRKASVVASVSMPTPRRGDPDAVIDALASAAECAVVRAKLPLSDVASIGVGSPGLLDLENGLVVAMPNLSGWDRIGLQQKLSERTGWQVVLENDANAAAYGEFWAGAGRDPAIQHMVMLTLGTGIGSGLVIDGRILHGGFGLGGEGGHTIIGKDGPPCGCGQHGCVESFASAPNTVRRAREQLDAGVPSSLSQMRQPLSAKDVFDAAKAGDALARTVAEQTADALAIACINFCRILDPQMIVLAGGMILAGDYLIDLVRTRFSKRTWSLVPERVQIVPAELGNDAGFIGAAAVAMDAQQRGRLDT